MNLEQEVKSAMPEIMARIKAEALSQVERQAVQIATDEALKAARAWAIEVLVPEIRAQMDAGKDGMVLAAKKAAEGVGDAVAAALIENATKTLSTSYNARKVAEALFSGY